MFCSNCSRLAILFVHRICIRCGLEVLNNLSVLCERCSSSEKVCSICLKKINNSVNHQRNRGCSGCGR